MAENDRPASEMKTIIELVFILWDALLLCNKLKDDNSAPQRELVRQLSNSYTIANEILCGNNQKYNEVRSVAEAKIPRRQIN